MPEQYERIKTFIENQNKITMPSLSDDQFNILNRRLIEKYTTHQLAMISYFKMVRSILLQLILNVLIH